MNPVQMEVSTMIRSSCIALILNYKKVQIDGFFWYTKEERKGGNGKGRRKRGRDTKASRRDDTYVEPLKFMINTIKSLKTGMGGRRREN